MPELAFCANPGTLDKVRHWGYWSREEDSLAGISPFLPVEKPTCIKCPKQNSESGRFALLFFWDLKARKRLLYSLVLNLWNSLGQTN